MRGLAYTSSDTRNWADITTKKFPGKQDIPLCSVFLLAAPVPDAAYKYNSVGATSVFSKDSKKVLWTKPGAHLYPGCQTFWLDAATRYFWCTGFLRAFRLVSRVIGWHQQHTHARTHKINCTLWTGLVGSIPWWNRVWVKTWTKYVHACCSLVFWLAARSLRPQRRPATYGNKNLAQLSLLVSGNCARDIWV